MKERNLFTDPILRLRRSVQPFFKTLYPFLLAGWIVAHSVLVRLTLNSWGQDVQMIISSSPGSYALAVFFFIYLGICTWRTVPWRYGSNVFDTLESHTNRMEPVMAEVSLGIWLVRIIRLLASTKYGNRTNFWTFPFSLVGKMFWALILLFVSDPVSSFSSSLFFYIFVLCLWSCLNFVFVFIFYIICLLPQQNSRSYRLSVTVPYSVKPFFFFTFASVNIIAANVSHMGLFQLIFLVSCSKADISPTILSSPPDSVHKSGQPRLRPLFSFSISKPKRWKTHNYLEWILELEKALQSPNIVGSNFLD